MSKLIFTESYEKRAKKFFKHHSLLIKQYEKTLKLLKLNPLHPSLRFHKLQGKQGDIYSVAINISYQITIDFIIEKDTIIPIDIGSHTEVY